MGLKIPLGKYNDSSVVYRNPATGQKFYTIDPLTIQTTNGSQDFIFYGFVYHGFPEKKFRIFSNIFYIKKGWNPLGQKFGDYFSVGLFAGQTFLKRYALTVQVRGEMINKMKWDHNIDMLALYNIDVRSTGSKKVFFSPQLSYTKGSLTIYALSEIPVYQYVNGNQVASQYQFTGGFSYRFSLK